MILPLDLNQWQHAGVDLSVVDVEDTLLAAEDAKMERRHRGVLNSLERTSDTILAAMEMHSFDSHVQLSLMNMKQHRQEADMVTAAQQNREYICAKRHAKSMLRNMEHGQSEWCQLPASCHVAKAEDKPEREPPAPPPPASLPRPIDTTPVQQEPPLAAPPRSPGTPQPRRSSTDGAKKQPFRPVGYSTSRVMNHSAAQSNIAALRKVQAPPATTTTSNINRVSLGLDLPPNRQIRSSPHVSRSAASGAFAQQRLSHSHRVSEQYVPQHNFGGLTVTPMTLSGCASGGGGALPPPPSMVVGMPRARRRSTASNFGSLSGDALDEGIASRSRTPEQIELLTLEDRGPSAIEQAEFAALGSALRPVNRGGDAAVHASDHSDDEFALCRGASGAYADPLLAAAAPAAASRASEATLQQAPAAAVAAGVASPAAAVAAGVASSSSGWTLLPPAGSSGGFAGAADQAAAVAASIASQQQHTAAAGALLRATMTAPAVAVSASSSPMSPDAYSTPASLWSLGDDLELAPTMVGCSMLLGEPSIHHHPPPGTAWRNLRLHRSRTPTSLVAAPLFSGSSTPSSPHSMASSSASPTTARQLWERPDGSSSSMMMGMMNMVGGDLSDNGGASTSTAASDYVGGPSSGVTPLRSDRSHAATPMSARSLMLQQQGGRSSSTALMASRLQGTVSSKSGFKTRDHSGSRINLLSAGGSSDRRHSYNGGLDLIRNGLNNGNSVFGRGT